MLRLGVDVGGTFIKAGVVDENYNILHKISVPTGGDAVYQKLVENIAHAAELAAREAGVDINEIASVGIGIPGLLNPKTGVVVLALQDSCPVVGEASPSSEGRHHGFTIRLL